MPEPNVANRTLFHGDNLDFLRAMDAECIDLIATDPPFNTSRNRSGTAGSYEDNWKWLPSGAPKPDQWRWESLVHEHWLEEIRDVNVSLFKVIDTARDVKGEGAAAFLCFLGVRLLEMHRVLKPTGTIYLHCDHTANSYIRNVMDAVFGEKNFRNELVWCYSGGGIPKNDYPRKHDTIFRYTKSGKYKFNVTRKPYKENTQQVGIHSTYSGPDNRIDLDRGTPLTDWWADIPTVTGWNPERTGSPDQKPLMLYERIVKASTDKGDWVLDPFSGCATTPIAAENLGRNWIGIDRRTDAEAHVLNRLLSTKGRVSDSKFIPFDDDGNPDPDKLTTARELVSDLGFTFTSDLPIPTEPPENAPYLQQIEGVPTRRRNRFTYAQMKAILIELFGPRCWGCAFVAPEDTHSHSVDRFLELDHVTPISGGGSHDLSNRALLCRPCNGDKSDTRTIVWLRQQAGYATGRKQGTRHEIDLEIARLRIEEHVRGLGE